MMKRKKSVVFMSSTTPHSASFYYGNALRKLDIVLTDIPFDPHQRQEYREFPEGDLLLLVDCGLPVEFPGLEEFKGRKGFVSIDSCHKLDIHREYCAKYRFDHVWVAQKPMVKELGPNAAWLPLAADEETHAFRSEWLRRDTLLRRMLQRDHYDIGMCCAPFKHRRGFEKLFRKAGLTTNFHFRKKFGSEATIETARCTIGFNAGIGFTGERGKDINMRVFETMANGRAMLLTNTYDGLGYEELFEEGMHYIGYRTEEEALEKALWYARHRDEAALIAREGQSHVLKNHTYLHRCRKILSVLDS